MQMLVVLGVGGGRSPTQAALLGLYVAAILNGFRKNAPFPGSCKLRDLSPTFLHARQSSVNCSESLDTGNRLLLGL